MGACSSAEEQPKPNPQAQHLRPSIAQQSQFVDLPVDKQPKARAVSKPKSNVLTFGDEALADSSDDETEERPYVMSSTFSKEQHQLSSAARSKGKMTAAEAAAVNNKNKMSSAEAAAAAKAAIAEAKQAIKNAEEREAKERELEQEREKERQKEQAEQTQRAQEEDEQRRRDEVKRQQENEAMLKAKQHQMMDMLAQGRSFIKHGRKGKPHARVVRYISAPKRVIDYSSGSIPVSEIQSVSAGKNSTVFRSVKDSAADPKVCFSLQCQQRSLDLQAESEAVRNEWIEALTFLLSPECSVSASAVAAGSALSSAADSLPVATMHLPPTTSPTSNLNQADAPVENKQPHAPPSHSPSSSVSPAASAPHASPSASAPSASHSHSPSASISPSSPPSPSLPLGPLGQTFIKHGRKGSPHSRIIKLWIKGVPGDKIDYQSGHILFKDIQTVQAGKQTKVWARVSEKHALASHCFSIITASRTLDLEADTQKQRDEWVTGLLALMKQYHYKR